MAIVTNSNQIKYGGTKYLDPRHDPVATVDKLPKSLKEVFEGMTLTVLDSGDGTPKDYWYIGGQWVVKTTGGGSGQTYTAGDYIKIQGDVISVTGITPSEYATKAQLSAETEARESAVNNAKNEAITASTAWTEAQGYLTEVPAEYAKSEDVATAITEAVSTKQDAFEFGQGLGLDENNALNVLIDDVTIKLNGSNKLYAVGGGSGQTYTAGDYIKIEGNEISVTGITPDDYATVESLSAETQARLEAEETINEKFDDYAKLDEVSSAITEAQDETFAAATAWTEEQGFLKEVPSEYVTEAEVSSAITEAQDETFAAATAWTEEQGFLKEVPAEYAKSEDVATAITASKEEAVEDAFNASTAWTEQQGYLTGVPAEYVTVSELNNEINDAKDEMFSETTVWVEGQGYLTGVPAEYATIADVTAATEGKQDAFSTGDGLELDNDVLKVLVDDVTIKLNGSNKLYAVTTSTGGSYTAGEYISIDGNEISVTGITPDDYATVGELSAETQARIEADFVIEAKFSEYPKIAEVNSAITEAQDETLAAATAWTEAQGYLKEVPAEYATVSEVSSAITEAQDETFAAATAWTEEQGYLTEVPNTFATKAEVSSAKTEAIVEAELYADSIADGLSTAITAAQAAAVADATAWTEAQGYLTGVPAEYATVSEVSSAITEAQEEVLSAATAWTEAQGYLTEVPAEYATTGEVASALTEAKDYTDAAVSAITVPEYSISSITPTSGYSAAYQLTKDGAAVSGSSIINIPDAAGATIRSAITTDVAVGLVSAGTTFSAGTTIESILRAIFISNSPVSIGYAYYGSLATPLDETTGITAENIKAYLTRSESAASTTPWRFRVNAGDYQIIVAVPDTFDLDDANDITDSIPYYYEISNNGDPRKTLTIDGIGYNVYYVTYGIELTRFQMEITLVNA